MKATVADELEFDSWPEEQKELARRVLASQAGPAEDEMEERLSNERSEGYSDGYSVGYEDGYDTGYEAAEKAAIEDEDKTK